MAFNGSLLSLLESVDDLLDLQVASILLVAECQLDAIFDHFHIIEEKSIALCLPSMCVLGEATKNLSPFLYHDSSSCLIHHTKL